MPAFLSRSPWTAAARLVAAAGVAVPLALPASDFGGQQGYNFADANQQIANTSTASLIQQKRGGAFNYNYSYNTNIGQQVNCNLSITATGNAAQPTNSGSGISPSGILNSGITATTTGNQSTSTNSPTGAVNGAGMPQTGQSNSGSSLGSSVAGSSMASQVGPINASGASIQNSVDNTQSNQGSSILATSNGSSACQTGATSQASVP